METTHIRRLLEMLDHPDAYTEQDIQDLINRDEETRETYRLLVEAKRSSRHSRNRQPVDVDAAWQRLGQARRAKQEQSAARTGRALQGGERPKAGLRRDLGWMKIAAAVVGVLLVSGIAFAALRLVRNAGEGRPSPVQETRMPDAPQAVAPDRAVAADTAAVRPITFDNVPLDEMLLKIAASHQAEVVFLSDGARSLRFYFVWYKEQPLEKVVETLNRFENVDIEMDGQKLLVR